jgi:hypothetical protein
VVGALVEALIGRRYGDRRNFKLYQGARFRTGNQAKTILDKRLSLCPAFFSQEKCLRKQRGLCETKHRNNKLERLREASVG